MTKLSIKNIRFSSQRWPVLSQINVLMAKTFSVASHLVMLCALAHGENEQFGMLKPFVCLNIIDMSVYMFVYVLVN